MRNSSKFNDQQAIIQVYNEVKKHLSDIAIKADNNIKLWKDVLDGASFINALYRPVRNQFRITGIQITGIEMQLNILVYDLTSIP
ncbi:12739_t:CDS:2 [Funneliformis geosporum]|nr:12739_t:CDS:2 [Funneliformis geosporum]